MRRIALLVTLVVLIGAGCSDDDEGVLTPPSTTHPPPAAEAETLTHDWGCGYGFTAGNEQQTVALVVQLDQRLWVDQARLPRTADLAGGTWTATVRQGRHLFANWCDDVILMDDPQPVVTAELPVTGGTLRIVRGRLGQTARPIVADLAGVVAEGPDGERVELGDLRVTNDCWGCFAG